MESKEGLRWGNFGGGGGGSRRGPRLGLGASFACFLETPFTSEQEREQIASCLPDDCFQVPTLIALKDLSISIKNTFGSLILFF